MIMETGVTHSTINKKSPVVGLFFNYQRKRKLKKQIFNKFIESVENRDYQKIELYSSRYLKIK